MSSGIEIMQEAQVGASAASPAKAPAPLAVVEKTPQKINAVAAAPPSFAMPRTLADIKAFGEMMFASGSFKDVKSVAQACVKIVAGCSMGYSVVDAMNAFHFIEGKITPTAGEVRARIKRNGYRIKEWEIDVNGERVDPIKPNGKTVNGAAVVIREKVDGVWEDLEPCVFTLQDAITAGLSGKDNWKKYSKAMFSARALTIAARKHCAEVFGGPVYLAEELNPDVVLELNADGELVPVAGAVTLESKSVDRKPMTGGEIKALYADARKVDPALPEDISAYAAQVVDGYDPARNPKGREMLALEERLREILANGVAPAAPPSPAAEAVEAVEAPPAIDAVAAVEGEVQSLLEYAAEKIPQAPPQEPSAKPVSVPQAAPEPVPTPKPSPAAAAAPSAPQTAPEPVTEGASYGPPPANQGEPMTKPTQGRLFACLGELGYKGKQRHSWCASYGVDVPKDESGEPTFGALREPLAAWLADRAKDELRLTRMEKAKAKALDPEAEYPACGFEGGAHGAGCPEGNPPR